MTVFILLDNIDDSADKEDRIIGVYATYEKAENAMYEWMMDGDFARRDEIIHDEKTGRFMYDDGSGNYYIVERIVRNFDYGRN